MKAGQQTIPQEYDPKYIKQIITQDGNYILGKAKNAIIKPVPELTFFDYPFLYLNTINVIEGQQGTNKSRLAETICGAILRKDRFNDNGFIKKVGNSLIHVAYVETERNHNEQSPKGIQHIKQCAGYKFSDDLPLLTPWPLTRVPRLTRLASLRLMIEEFHLNNLGQHLFVVLDLATDCISDFNSITESYSLIDLMLELNNSTSTTFLAVIHQNPGSPKDYKKARGHIGTELINKCTLAVELGYGKPKDGISNFYLNIKKARNNKLYSGCNFSVNEDTQMMDVVRNEDNLSVNEITSIQVLRDGLYSLYEGDLKRIIETKELTDYIAGIIHRKSRTATGLIKTFVVEGYTILTSNGDEYLLKQVKIKGGNKNGYIIELIS